MLFGLSFFFCITHVWDAVLGILGKVDIRLIGLTLAMNVVNGEDQTEDDEGQEEDIRIMAPLAVFSLLFFGIFSIRVCLFENFCAGPQGSGHDR